MTKCQLESVAEIQAFVHDQERIHVCGNGSKTALHINGADASRADLSTLKGIIEYQPSEYTVTAYAGSAVATIAAALAEHGQYLPFDPPFPARATIGGTVAANLSGPRRLRYGGVRDFILGGQVVDGLGRAFRVGGKVVKNAAGFDLSKFLVGSLGQYAIMTELTFKVFPDVPHFRSLRCNYRTLDEALRAIYFLNQSVFELDALDLLPADAGWSVLARLGGFAQTLAQRVERFTERMRQETAPVDISAVEEEGALWDPVAGLTGAYLIKVPLSPKQIPAFDAQFEDIQRRYSVGGNLAWVALDDIQRMNAVLAELCLTGLCLRGAARSPIVGISIQNALAARVKRVLDPMNKLI